jgi:hypothetical protein
VTSDVPALFGLKENVSTIVVNVHCFFSESLCLSTMAMNVSNSDVGMEHWQSV